VSRGAARRVHGSPTAPAPGWASGRARGEARRPTKELWAAPMTSSNRFFNDVASVCFECLRCFEEMLQPFHMVVAKADLDVAMLKN
jgi:hypothetical protein